MKYTSNALLYKGRNWGSQGAMGSQIYIQLLHRSYILPHKSTLLSLCGLLRLEYVLSYTLAKSYAYHVLQTQTDNFQCIKSIIVTKILDSYIDS